MHARIPKKKLVCVCIFICLQCTIKACRKSQLVYANWLESNPEEEEEEKVEKTAPSTENEVFETCERTVTTAATTDTTA